MTFPAPATLEREKDMSIHPADHKADNPRLQCSCCGEWKRLYRRDHDGTVHYRFFGGCGYTNGDHLAGKNSKDGCRDVCDDCCQIECRRLAMEREKDK